MERETCENGPILSVGLSQGAWGDTKAYEKGEAKLCPGGDMAQRKTEAKCGSC